MRDLIAGLVAALLLVAAASLATTLRLLRLRRRRALDRERARGRTIVAEIPAKDDLLLFSEDAAHFYVGERAIDKDAIETVTLLVNGTPLARYDARRAVSGVHQSGRGRGAGAESGAPAAGSDEGAEGLTADRWDVAVATADETMLVECGGIRERVSQELARAVFDRVKHEIEHRDYHSSSARPAR